MKSVEVRQRFLNYFKSKGHHFIPSSSMVINNDPTLLFVNAGMNQFKDIFLGHSQITYSKVVNSQKCLRVSGKHNDLEEVGHDTYHHTMFEMLGNWSFGDYFKQIAISLAWDFLTKELNLSEDRLYVTFFEGDKKDKLSEDSETKRIWSEIISSDKIIGGVKKDNFWEMGKIGPCGPSTEIHIDLRKNAERELISAQSLINKDHPEVIEIWNIVFIEFNRKKNGELVLLPNKHVDTGMGFERLCMILQDKVSTYDTDLFENLIKCVSSICSINYGHRKETDIAIRVIVDHIRAIVFAIGDGQLPSNTGAGYVIRRILRRAVRYAYTYLNLKEPFLYQLVDSLSNQFKTIFPEINNQKETIRNVIRQEEKVFLNTLGKGLELINKSIKNLDQNMKMNGRDVFELYDTYGFPQDLTRLILKEKGFSYNQIEFDDAMEEQKKRSRSASEIILGDWVVVNDIPIDGFMGYNETAVSSVKLVKYRKVQISKKERFHLVFDKTPFYPEGGGQIGDQGIIIATLKSNKDIVVSVLDTKKENNLIIHITEKLPGSKRNWHDLLLQVNNEKRQLTTRNHSATHLLHFELRNRLGFHVEQKGSYVGPDYLRFDFSHFQKIDKKELLSFEKNINQIISKSIPLEEYRNLPIIEAKKIGALALFGEKYEDNVRVIKYQCSSDMASVELCGGTHVSNTSEIGLFKIISESSIASGIRRIEAVTSLSAISFMTDKINLLDSIQNLFKNSDDIITSISNMINENKELIQVADIVKKNKTDNLIKELDSKILENNDIKILISELDIDVGEMKNICFSFIQQYTNMFVALLTKKGAKLILNIAISKNLVEDKKISASKIINQVSPYINGRGGGQPFFAVASGDNEQGVEKLFDSINNLIINY